MRRRLTPEERAQAQQVADQRNHLHMIKVVDGLIEGNMERARKPWQSPHMVSYYVRVARLQNGWLRLSRRQALALGAERVPPRRSTPYGPRPKRVRASNPVLTPWPEESVEQVGLF